MGCSAARLAILIPTGRYSITGRFLRLLCSAHEGRRAVEHLNLTTHWAGIASLACFVVAYGIAMAEERLQVRKSVPVLVAAIVIWILVGLAFAQNGAGELAAEAARHTLLDFAELMLFLIPARRSSTRWRLACINVVVAADAGGAFSPSATSPR
jgi:hypothetical protein